MIGPKPGAATSTTSPDYVDDWRDQAACFDHPEPDMWFATGTHREALDDKAEAKRICVHECPVRYQCLQWALDTREPYGILGGLDEDQRRRNLLGPATSGSTCGTSGGRSRHHRAGTPVCAACLAYETQQRNQSDLRTWAKAAPLIARGLTYEQAGDQLGLARGTIRRAHTTARRLERQQAEQQQAA